MICVCEQEREPCLRLKEKLSGLLLSVVVLAHLSLNCSSFDFSAFGFSFFGAPRRGCFSSRGFIVCFSYLCSLFSRVPRYLAKVLSLCPSLFLFTAFLLFHNCEICSRCSCKSTSLWPISQGAHTGFDPASGLLLIWESWMQRLKGTNRILFYFIATESNTSRFFFSIITLQHK